MSAELRQLIREAIAEYPKADPRELARYVAKLTPVNSLIDFYVETLVDYVSSELRIERNHAFSENRSGHANRSPKVEQRGSWWQDILAARVHVGKTFWKTLGDCTIEDLTFCVKEREGQIDGLNHQISHFRRLIDLMAEHGAPTVNDLPPQEKWDAK